MARPSDEEVRRFARHLIEAFDGSPPSLYAMMGAALADHLLWTLGEAPHFNPRLPEEIAETLADLDRGEIDYELPVSPFRFPSKELKEKPC